LSEPVVAFAVDELVGALHGLHESLLFFVQRTDDAKSHRFSIPVVVGSRFFSKKQV
jgi:hypothetical protein